MPSQKHKLQPLLFTAFTVEDMGLATLWWKLHLAIIARHSTSDIITGGASEFMAFQQQCWWCDARPATSKRGVATLRPSTH